ncbi:hypothetical protein PLICRDRAFT_298278 [Plicaturopsis crispa FD-325 SS-3]|nr:hypothetical protein PLICRDRAFT_298278 [Plicaturopsis crispa FD-325 SS-3]
MYLYRRSLRAVLCMEQAVKRQLHGTFALYCSGQRANCITWHVSATRRENMFVDFFPRPLKITSYLNGDRSKRYKFSAPISQVDRTFSLSPPTHPPPAHPIARPPQDVVLFTVKGVRHDRGAPLPQAVAQRGRPSYESITLVSLCTRGEGMLRGPAAQSPSR